LLPDFAANIERTREFAESGPPQFPLPAAGDLAHAPTMFMVSEAEATAIRTAFERGGEFSAAVELRRLFPGVSDNGQARDFARTIAGWKPLAPSARKSRTWPPRTRS
jgi:hypothetical protein